jgi:hypothetical protein
MMCVDCGATGKTSTAHGSGVLLLALLPKIGCPLCWPVLAVVMGSFGVRVESLNEVLLAVAVAVLIAATVGYVRRKIRRTHFFLIAISLAMVILYRLGLVSAVMAYVAGAGVMAYVLLPRIASTRLLFVIAESLLLKRKCSTGLS